MKIFALQTDLNVTKADYLKPGESEVLFVRPHVISFILRSSISFLLTIILASVAIYLTINDIVQASTATLLFLIIWFVTVFFGLARSYIDWRYDFLMLTTDTLILADQSSFFRKSIRPVGLDSISSVQAETQWLHLFGFGIVVIALDQGKTPPIILRFMPDAERIVSLISQQIATFLGGRTLPNQHS